MYNLYSRITPHKFGLLVTCAIMSLGIGLASPIIASAQTDPNQAYDCGTYGGGNYGQNDCVTTTETTPTPNISTTQSPTPNAGGSSPDTGASLTWWAAIGALLVAVGLGLYGYNRRQRRLSQR
jgi:LPXTG-motif cell wall-anchored protein